jgi:soluble cytochrome b562
MATRDFIWKAERLARAISALEHSCSAEHRGIISNDARRKFIEERDRLIGELDSVYKMAEASDGK